MIGRTIAYGVAALAGCLVAANALAQGALPPKPRDWDKEMTAALQKAKDAAGFEWLGTLNRLCVLPPSNGAPSTADAVPAYVADPKTAPPRETWYADPAKVADDFYWLGGKVHSAWVFGDEKDGYFLFDQQYTYNSEELVLGGMKKLGLDVSKVKYHFTSHDHGDHVGAIQMINKAAPDAKDVMGTADYQDMLKFPKRNTGVTPLNPANVIQVDKPTTFTLGSRSVQVIPTPGHTPGTTSYIFTVTDRGKPLTVAYSGGTAFNFQTDKADPGVPNLQQYINSNQALADAAMKAKATMLISNHSEFDMADKKAKMLRGRAADEANPFALGEDWTQRYFQVAINCAEYKSLQLQRDAAGGK
ncbi:MAG: MBL fold metallo-hydrolase [Bauldia sp.]